MKLFFAFFDDDMAFFKVGCGAGLGDVGDLYVVDGNAALLHEAAEKACSAAELIVAGDIDKAMSNFNG